MIDDAYFNRIYTELMAEQVSLLNEVKNGMNAKDMEKNHQRQIAAITSILNHLSRLRDLKSKKTE
tara:strand:+ start:629 stop:823 length:195 start_codon:yes stop_codon:yes gene_type:complete